MIKSRLVSRDIVRTDLATQPFPVALSLSPRVLQPHSEQARGGVDEKKNVKALRLESS